MRIISALLFTLLVNFWCPQGYADPDPATPFFDISTNVLTLPTVAADGLFFGPVTLLHEGDLRFSVLSVFGPIVSETTLSAAHYANGELRLSGVLVAGRRYSRAVFRLVNDSQFQLTEIVEPVQVLPTDYENRHDIDIADPTIPPLAEFSDIVQEPAEMNAFNQRIAFADFFQEGSMSAVAFSWVYRQAFKPEQYPGGYPQPDSPAKVYFLKKNAAGEWIDGTSQLLRNDDRYVCVMPSLIEVADFNNDGMPDVVVSCTGIDFPLIVPEGTTDANEYLIQFSLADQYLLLSQVDGSYQRKLVPTTNPRTGSGLYAHDSAAADFDGDGNTDIVYVDAGGNLRPQMMWGNGDGTFTQDGEVFPEFYYGKAHFGTGVIKVDDRIQVYISTPPPGYSGPSADEFEAGGTQIYEYRDGHMDLVADLSAHMPNIPGTATKYGYFYDFIYANGAYYGYTTDHLTANEHAIIKFDSNTLAGTVVSAWRRGPAYAGAPGNFRLVNGKFVIETMGCGARRNDPQDWFYQICNISVPIQ